MDILKQVYYAICKDSLHTRKEIAEYIGVSTVTVGKAVDTLTQNGFITSRGKLSGELGRKSEFLDISDNNVLLIDLTSDDFSYSISPMSRDSIDPLRVEYIGSLDFTDNLSLLLSHIRSSVADIPKLIFVAVPGINLNGSLVETHVSDYSTASLADVFEKHSIIPTEIVSCSNAVSLYCGNNDLFVYVGNYVWGSIARNYLKNISDIPIGGSDALTYADALKCADGPKKMTEYTLRFLKTLDAVLSPDTIMLYTGRFSSDDKATLCSALPKLKCSDDVSPVFYGLMELCINTALDKKYFCKKMKNHLLF